MEVGSGIWANNLDGLTQSINDRLSLEGTVLYHRAHELRSQAAKLARKRAFLREERRRARMEEEALRQDKMEFGFVKQDDWLPKEYLPQPDVRRIKVNVGGQVFEASENVLRRDPGSMLAALCDEQCPVTTEQDGLVYVDRDWWTFRYVLKFMRDGVLPTDRTLLAQLYQEAGFWRCASLKRAIEEHMKLYRTEFEVDKLGKVSQKKREEEGWWTKLPHWWEAKPAKKDDKKAEAPPKDEKAAKSKDWWTGAEYNGRKYTVLSKSSDKVITGADQPDAKPMTQSTWSTVAAAGPRSTW